MKKPRTIYSDGKEYTFTPGRGGSLTYQNSLTDQGLLSDMKESRARVIGSALDKAVAKKKRKKTPPNTAIGAIRG